MRIRALAVTALSSLLVAGLTGCAPGATASHSCVSWVDFADPQAMYDEATLVVSGVADAAEGSIELLSGPGERHRFEVDEVYKGDFDGDELWAAAPRDYCVAEPPQPADDPIPTGERVILFLHPASSEPVPVGEEPEPADVEAWSVLTPLAGVVPLPAGAPLPMDVEG